MSRHRPGGPRARRAVRAFRVLVPTSGFVLVAFHVTAASVAAQSVSRAPSLDERIVVTADFEALPRDEVGSSVTTIEHEEIERRGYRTVLELLRTVPGVEVTHGGGPGKVATARVRGGDASQTLVLIDGVRVNDSTTGDFDFADLLTDGIERIEIVRGPQALWGSEAVSGVVAITTRRGAPGGRLGGAVEGGSDDLFHARLAADGGGERADYALTAAHFSTDGVSHNSERAGNTEVDPYENLTLSGRFGFALGEDGRLDLVSRYTRGENELDGFLDDDPNALGTREAVTLSASWRQEVSERFSQTVLLAGSDTNLLGEDPDSPFNVYDIDARTLRVEARSTFRASEATTLVGGLSAEQRSGENVGSFDESADLRSGFVHARWALRDRYFLTAAARVDDHTSFGSELTWRGTGSFRLGGSSTRLHASVGTAFRAPDLNELFFPFAGNPELSPETSLGFDVGVEQAWRAAGWCSTPRGSATTTRTSSTSTSTRSSSATSPARGPKASSSSCARGPRSASSSGSATPGTRPRTATPAGRCRAGQRTAVIWSPTSTRRSDSAARSRRSRFPTASIRAVCRWTTTSGSTSRSTIS